MAEASGARNVVVLPRNTRNLSAALEENGVRQRQQLPPRLADMVQRWREPRHVPQELFAETASKARSDPGFFSEELLAPHYVADLSPDQCNSLVNAEALSLLALPKISRHIAAYMEYTVSEATWTQQIYSQLIGEPFIAAADMVNAERQPPYWYMFMSDTNWTPGVFKMATGGHRGDSIEDPFVIQEAGTNEAVLLKPDQFLAYVPPPEETARVYHTFFLGEHKKDSNNRTESEKLLLEGCATLVARSRYVHDFAADENLRWMPLIYCAGGVVDIILMWYNPETKKFEYARIRPTAYPSFKLDRTPMLMEFHKVMHGLAEAVQIQMSSITADSFDQNKIIDFTRLSTKRTRPEESQQRGGSERTARKQQTTKKSNQSTSSIRKKTATYPYVAACERAIEKMQANHFTPLLAANIGFYFGPGNCGEWESLLQELPVAVLTYKDPPGRTFIKIFNNQQRREAQREASVQAVLSAQPFAAAPRILHNINVRVGRKTFIVLEIEDAGDTSYLPKSFTELQSVMRQTLTAIATIHSMGFVHCDLKPEHIAVRRSTGPEGDAVAVSVVDWGMAVQLDSPSDTFQPNGLGTEGFSAPEMKSGKGCTAAADIFSLGCTFRELAARGDALVQYQGTPSWVTLFQLVSQMLSTTPAARPTAQAALNHPFFSLTC